MLRPLAYHSYIFHATATKRISLIWSCTSYKQKFYSRKSLNKQIYWIKSKITISMHKQLHAPAFKEDFPLQLLRCLLKSRKNLRQKISVFGANVVIGIYAEMWWSFGIFSFLFSFSPCKYPIIFFGVSFPFLPIWPLIQLPHPGFLCCMHPKRNLLKKERTLQSSALHTLWSLDWWYNFTMLP